MLALAAALSAPSLLAGQQRAASDSIPYDSLAARIVAALGPDRGERAILRVHAPTMPALASRLSERLRSVGVSVDVMDYGDVPDFERRLAAASIYVWLPTPSGVAPTPRERAELTRWLQSKRGRQIHFHWSSITTTVDGQFITAPPGYDRLHTNAVLAVDYARMRRELDRLASQLRRGEVRVPTPNGTDVRFSVGDRPITTQDGDASRTRLADSRVPIDREIELPAGVLRVAPLERTVTGPMVIPALHLDAATVARDVRLTFAAGRATQVASATHETRVRELFTSTPALVHFRELGIGVNPILSVTPTDSIVPYAGYGAGVVRLGLGDNTELGGTVRGGAVRWIFFSDATVTVGRDTLVARGRLRSR